MSSRAGSIPTPSARRGGVDARPQASAQVDHRRRESVGIGLAPFSWAEVHGRSDVRRAHRRRSVEKRTAALVLGAASSASAPLQRCSPSSTRRGAGSPSFAELHPRRRRSCGGYRAPFREERLLRETHPALRRNEEGPRRKNRRQPQSTSTDAADAASLATVRLLRERSGVVLKMRELSRGETVANGKAVRAVTARSAPFPPERRLRRRSSANAARARRTPLELGERRSSSANAAGARRAASERCKRRRT
jgi:hypothetical protein